MKRINREAIQRMVDARGGKAVGTSGGGGGSLAGYATQAWVNEGFVSIEFFNRLFTVYGPGATSSDPDVVVEPNDLDSTITNIKAMFGLWTEQYLSALGLNPGGTGSATSLSMLDDVDITTPTNGQALVYNSTTLKWENGSGFLPLTGGTLDSDSERTVLSLNNTNQYGPEMRFLKNGVFVGRVYSDTDRIGFLLPNRYELSLTSTGIIFSVDAGTTNYYVLHQGNTKTINGQSLYGSGDINIGGGGGDYLPLSGGTLTNNAFAGQLTIKRNADGDSVIKYSGLSDAVYGYMGFRKDHTPIVYTDAAASGTGYPILHSNNVGSYALPLTGGTVNGNVVVNGALTIYNATNPLFRITQGNGSWYIQVYEEKLFLGFGIANSVSVTKVGRVGIGLGTTAPSYALHVSGSIYATSSITALSDIKQKNIKEYMQLGIDEVANAPIIKFTWKDPKAEDKSMQVGSIAQYWEKVLPEAVKKDKEGTLSMSYGVVALVAAISTAKKVQEHEQRIADLECENKKLKGQLIRLNRYG